MARKAVPILVSAGERAILEGLIHSRAFSRSKVDRARIILLLASGLSNKETGQRLKIRQDRISRWRKRFATAGVRGLADDPRTGRPSKTRRDMVESVALAAQLRLSLQGLQIGGRQVEVVGLYLDGVTSALAISASKVTGRNGDSGSRRSAASLSRTLGATQPDSGNGLRLTEFMHFLRLVDRRCRRGEQLYIFAHGARLLSGQGLRTWARQNQRVEFRVAPTYGFWLEQVELWLRVSSWQLSTAGPGCVDTLVGALQTSSRRLGSFYWIGREPAH